MRAEMIILLLAVCLGLCLAAFFISTVYFWGQWRKLDRILDGFWREDTLKNGLNDQDVEETRESRVVSQLQRILNSARYKEQQAVGEKDRIK